MQLLVLHFCKTLYPELSYYLRQCPYPLPHSFNNREEVIELFQFVDIDSSKIIELKEFLVALTCGYVLESIPTFRSINQNAETGSELTKSASTNAVAPDPSAQEEVTEEAELKKMLNLIAIAYLLFDPECDGVINKKSLERWVEEGGVKVHKNKELSEHLWKLMVRFLTVIYARRHLTLLYILT